MKRSFARATAVGLLAFGTYSLTVEPSTGEHLPLQCGVEQSAYRQAVMEALLAAAAVHCVPVSEAVAKDLGGDNLVVSVDDRCVAVFSIENAKGEGVVKPELAGPVAEITSVEALNGKPMLDGSIVHLDEIDSYGKSIPNDPSLHQAVGLAAYIHDQTVEGCARLGQ